MTRLIFICHGQLPHEKQAGLNLKAHVEAPGGFHAFFAEAVQSTDALSEHIFGNLERCDGFLAVMHKRGDVTYPGGRITRASVWVQQELAIVTFLNYLRRGARRVPIRVYAEKGIDPEGLATALILNPIPFAPGDDLRDSVRDWLTGPEFAIDPIASTRDELFRNLTSKFTDRHWTYLQMMMVLSRGTADQVAMPDLNRVFAQIRFLSDNPDHVGQELVDAGLISPRMFDKERKVDCLRLSPAFIDLVADELRIRGLILRVPQSNRT